MSSILDDIGFAFADVLPLLEKIAPSIATAIGGPLAGQAVQFLENGLGLTGGATPAAVAAAVAAATPEQLAAIKKVDNDFVVQMKQLDISIEKLDYDDRNSARNRESSVHDKTPSTVTYLLIFGVFATVVAVETGYASASETLNGMIFGYLFSELKAATSYYFGSSRSSQAKDVMLYNAAPTSTSQK